MAKACGSMALVCRPPFRQSREVGGGRRQWPRVDGRNGRRMRVGAKIFRPYGICLAPRWRGRVFALRFPSGRTGGVGTVTTNGRGGHRHDEREGWAPSRRTGGVGAVRTNGRGRRRQDERERERWRPPTGGRACSPAGGESNVGSRTAARPRRLCCTAGLCGWRWTGIRCVPGGQCGS